jgi:TolB-like protein/Flp pilus assembly protein TadD/predicted Ser/Thr protein kinase
MNSERWRRLEQLYHAALELEPARRDSFLADECREDSDLRREVESLLTQTGSSSALVDHSAWAAVGKLKAETRREWKPGETLGPYKVLKLLGQGGMGAVYRAIDTRLDREVAVKICDERFSGRFERELRAISALNHPNICTLYDAGPDYLVMELIEGDTLRDLLQRGLPPDSGLNIAKQVLSALGAAHAAGIVHRDLKPANIMVRVDGYVKVLDFGLAKRIPSGTAGGDLTAGLDISLPGQMLGTVAYMSPEQIAGETVDQRSDLFAFGILLYEMLTGQHPWPRASPVEVLHAILHDDAPPIERTFRRATELAPVMCKLLRKNSTARYKSAGAVLQALASPSGERSGGVVTALTSIAVLPFAMLGEVEGREALSLGFADALITMLGNLDDVFLPPMAAILKYVPGAEPAQVCRELGVRYALQGNVQKLGADWRLSMHLFDMNAQRITFSDHHEFSMENIFEVQDEIGRRVMSALGSRFARHLQKSRDRYSSNPEAYDEFMAGLRATYGDSPGEFHSAVQRLSRAVELDTEFALAHAWLSHVSMQLHYYFDPRRVWLEKAEYHYERALMLDPNLPEAHWARCAILWSSAKNFQHAEAIAALERVLAVRPNFDRAHNRMAAICMHIGRFQEARIADERAQRCNPRNRSYNREFICQYSGEFARAKELGEAWFKESPRNKNALWYSAHSLLLTGDLDEAGDRLTLALAQYPEEPLFVTMRGMLHARRRQSEAAIACVQKALEYPVSFGHAHHTYHHVACIYSELGETEKAMAWLEKSVDSGNPCWPFFRTDPFLENLRREPRFQQLVAALEREFTALPIGRL